MKKSTLAQRIRAARKRAGLTQADVAAHFGVDRSAITMWESTNPNVRTRPDISKLEAFARLTRSPAWWLLSDASDPDEPWPEINDENPSAAERGANSWFSVVRAFWAAVSLHCREQRSDLWDADIWEPKAPAWLAPLTPDILTERSAVELLVMSRPLFSRVAQAMAKLIAFEQAYSPILQHGHRYERKVVLVWAPEQPPVRAASGHYRDELDQLYARAERLGRQLGVTYYLVKDEDEAVAYLLQIL